MVASDSSGPSPIVTATVADALRLAALGLNAWAVLVALPVFQGGLRNSFDLMVAMLPLVPLALGLRFLQTAPLNGLRGNRLVETGALLIAFPIALAVGAAARIDLVAKDAWSAFGLAAAVASMMAYGAYAAESCGRATPSRASTAQPLNRAGARPNLTRTWLRRSLLATLTVGAVLLAVVAPMSGTRVELIRRWSEAANEATVLACIVGTAAGSIGLAALLGPSFRAARKPEISTAQQSLRIAAALLLATVTVTAFAVYRSLDHSP